jgi:hypothetical protein
MTLGEMPTTAWRLPYWPQLFSAFGRARRCCIRTSEKFPWRMFRLCEVALLGHYPRSVRHGSTVRKVFHLGVHVSEKGRPAPLNATGRWVVERTNSWQNAHEKLVWCTERRGRVVDFWVALSEVVIIVERLVREGWMRYRWEARPSRRP